MPSVRELLIIHSHMDVFAPLVADTRATQPATSTKRGAHSVRLLSSGYGNGSALYSLPAGTRATWIAITKRSKISIIGAVRRAVPLLPLITAEVDHGGMASKNSTEWHKKFNQQTPRSTA